DKEEFSDPSPRGPLDKDSSGQLWHLGHGRRPRQRAFAPKQGGHSGATSSQMVVRRHVLTSKLAGAILAPDFRFGCDLRFSRLPARFSSMAFMRMVFLFALVAGGAATVSDCIEEQCKGCGGEQCQLCREDSKTIETCVTHCIEVTCKGCGGEQCQLCREDAQTIESCCGSYDAPMCKATPKNPCDGIYGAEGLQCVWEESVKSCMETSCQGCGGEQCQLCQQDATRIATCCDDHWHSVDPPQMCKDAKAEAVSSCVEGKCRGCGGEQCQLCREDPTVLDQCCTGAMRTPQCEKTRSIPSPVLP
ncbi:unnamed protein product, partial [Effrenium voratum]